MHLLIKENATKDDLLMGLIHAYTVRSILKVDGYKGTSKLNFWEKMSNSKKQQLTESFDILRRARLILRKDNSETDRDRSTFINQNIGYTDVNSNNISDIDSESSIGNRTVREIMNSSWLVEELLLETRHARLEIS